MTQPPDDHGQAPRQWDPQNAGDAPPSHPEGQPRTSTVGPDGQPWNGPVGPDGQPWYGPLGPDGQPWNGPIGPDGQQHAGFTPGAPPKSNPFGIKRLVSALLVLAVLGVAAYFVWGSQQKSAALTVGNCVVWSGENQEDLEVKVVDCTDNTVYSEHIGEVLDGNGTCTDPNAVPYTFGASGASSEKTQKVGCAIPQLFEDNCYNVDEGTLEIELASCDAAQLGVTTVIEESDATCEGTDAAVSYVKPARTYCVAYKE